MTTIFKFANYTFDPHAGLAYEGHPVHLPPKEKGLLQALLAARGQIVRKEDLMVKVWGTSETSDESISRTVYRLRVAMQSTGGPEVVETVYNSGFRVTAPVREATLKESSSLNALTHSMRPSAIAALISAREFLARQSLEDIEAAAQAVRLAISIDPSFSAAWSTLAEIRIFQAMRSLRAPREAGWLAKEAAQTALQIEPQSASALAILGWVRVLIDQDCEGGLGEWPARRGGCLWMEGGGTGSTHTHDACPSGLCPGGRRTARRVAQRTPIDRRVDASHAFGGTGSGLPGAG